MTKPARRTQRNSHVITFREAGYGEWIDFTTYLPFARWWAGAGFTPQEAAQWRDGFTRPLGTTPQGAAAYRDRGFNPEDALRDAQERASAVVTGKGD